MGVDRNWRCSNSSDLHRRTDCLAYGDACTPADALTKTHERRAISMQAWRGALSITGAVMIAATVLWSAGLIWFAGQTTRSSHDTDTRTDAIIVLTGGSGRLAAGIALLETDLSDQLFVSGVAYGLRPEDVFDVEGDKLDGLSCCITFGHSADNTAENAAETAAWVRLQGFSSLRLVTASYHMPRSMMEFRKALPGVILVANPIYPANVKVDDWWYHRGTAGLIASEYAKSLLMMLKPSS